MIWTSSPSFIPLYPSFFSLSSTIVVQNYTKHLSDSITTPLLRDNNTHFSSLSTMFCTSSFAKSRLTTIATILVTIHAKLFLILHDRYPLSSSFYPPLLRQSFPKPNFDFITIFLCLLLWLSILPSFTIFHSLSFVTTGETAIIITYATIATILFYMLLDSSYFFDRGLWFYRNIFILSLFFKSW